MLVFGDRDRVATLPACLDEIEAKWLEVRVAPAGIVRHGLIAATLLAAGELAQALADDVQNFAGRDDPSPHTNIAMCLLRCLAAALLDSWRTGFAARNLSDICPFLLALRHAPVNGVLSRRTPEGFAFYAVYPEAYAVAAASLRAAETSFSVTGIRSIGTVLAAVVAEALGADSVQTLRPIGHPFTRIVTASAVLPDVTAMQVIVDEGPGASGSSFAAVADWLEASGAASDRIVFMPSHDGSPGPMASPAHLARWNTVRRRTVTFDTLSLHADRSEHRLENWFVDLVGPATAPLTDISGGAWRALRRIHAPCVPAFERQKYLLHTARGTWLLKFAGLGRMGEDAFALAADLHAAGLVTEPIGLRHGFLIERWHGEATVPPSDQTIPLQGLARYIGHRARHCPADTRDGAELTTLCHMARCNTHERLGERAADRLMLDATLSQDRRIRIDGRLHRWEWLQLPDGRLLKADALDHHAAHDLIGCQDVAWDIAGAIVEFDLSPPQAEALRIMVGHQAGSATDPRLIATHVLCYSAFQLGLWSFAADATDHVARYERRLTQAGAR